MTLEERLQSLSKWGLWLNSLHNSEQLEIEIIEAGNKNPWFTKSNIKFALEGISKWFDNDNISKWAKQYSLPQRSTNKIVGLVMAGNIPLVGFHDLLSVLVSGHIAKIKLSSQDNVLIPFLINSLLGLDPRWSNFILFEERLNNTNAVIATGSDNSARYFEYYFRNISRLIRKNRTSVGVVMGEENPEIFTQLGYDIFAYFGMGCRNVSKLYVPENFKIEELFKSFLPFEETINHNKYANNYDYQKSIRLISVKKFIDFGFLILEESNDMVSPISVLYYEYYSSQDHLNSLLKQNEAKIQCIVSANGWLAGSIPFGDAQQPDITDYADGIDTLKFLESI